MTQHGHELTSLNTQVEVLDHEVLTVVTFLNFVKTYVSVCLTRIHSLQQFLGFLAAVLDTLRKLSNSPSC